MDNKQKKIAFLGVLLLGCVATSWLQQGSNESKQGMQQLLMNKQLHSNSAKEGRSKTIEVYVSGAVAEPGIYILPAGARTTEALEAAGGLRPDAKAERVNLARKLRDGSHVYVPVEKRNTSKGKDKQGAGASIKDGTKAGAGAYGGFDASGGVSSNDSFTRGWDDGNDSSEAAGGNGFTGKVNLNTATQQQLIALPGIGPSMANRILALRRVRRFNRVEDLLQVRGIGQAKLERLRPYVRVE